MLKSMAGEVSHVVYGNRVKEYLGDRVEDASFWVGTLFPDIRHLGVVSRHRTHPEDVSLTSLVGDTDFATGLRVHAWVDATRERFLRDQNMKEALPWHPFTPHALKLYEDELLYSKFSEWDLVDRVLNTVHKEEQRLVNDEEAILRWHMVLKSYFQQKPTQASRVALSEAIGLSKTSAEEIESIVERLRSHERTQELLEEFWGELDRLLT